MSESKLASMIGELIKNLRKDLPEGPYAHMDETPTDRANSALAVELEALIPTLEAAHRADISTLNSEWIERCRKFRAKDAEEHRAELLLNQAATVREAAAIAYDKRHWLHAERIETPDGEEVSIDETPWGAILALPSDQLALDRHDAELWAKFQVEAVKDPGLIIETMLAEKVQQAVREPIEALSILYEETADYIRINNLGDVHHNRSMQYARDVLAAIRAAAGAPEDKK